MDITSLPAIPVYDIRNRSLADLALEHQQDIHHMMNGVNGTFGIASKVGGKALLPIGDAIVKKWLERNKNIYLGEIEQIAQGAKIPGIYALNLCYEWGCSSGVFESPDGMRLLRVLDWPFNGLGECTIVLHQQGAAGEFHNVTWPGLTGVYNAMAAGRFAAAINQAPMRRHRNGIVIDWLKNRLSVQRSTAWPPSHLLRYVFEQARDYAEAKKMLTEMPLALPVLYILSGINPGEGCVIERLENEEVVRDMKDGRVTVSNHFQSHFNGIGHGWMPRAVDSKGRYDSIQCTNPALTADPAFGWFIPPIANHLSRLAYSANAGNGNFMAIGTEGATPLTYLNYHR